MGSSKQGKEEDPVVLSTIFLKTSGEAAGVTKKRSLLHCSSRIRELQDSKNN